MKNSHTTQNDKPKKTRAQKTRERTLAKEAHLKTLLDIERARQRDIGLYPEFFLRFEESDFMGGGFKIYESRKTNRLHGVISVHEKYIRDYDTNHVQTKKRPAHCWLSVEIFVRSGNYCGDRPLYVSSLMTRIRYGEDGTLLPLAWHRRDEWHGETVEGEYEFFRHDDGTVALVEAKNEEAPAPEEPADVEEP